MGLSRRLLSRRLVAARGTPAWGSSMKWACSLSFSELAAARACHPRCAPPHANRASHSCAASSPLSHSCALGRAETLVIWYWPHSPARARGALLPPPLGVCFRHRHIGGAALAAGAFSSSFFFGGRKCRTSTAAPRLSGIVPAATHERDVNGASRPAAHPFVRDAHPFPPSALPLRCVGVSRLLRASPKVASLESVADGGRPVASRFAARAIFERSIAICVSRSHD